MFSTCVIWLLKQVHKEILLGCKESDTVLIVETHLMICFHTYLRIVLFSHVFSLIVYRYIIKDITNFTSTRISLYFPIKSYRHFFIM